MRLFLLMVVTAATTCRCEQDAPAPIEEGLPGSPRHDPALAQRLAEATRGAAYQPRTRHLRPDGTPMYTNRLALEPSPYLLLHAHNPVEWYPWGDEAFAKAEREGKPVFLSIGYSTCHWCHVMAEESFEDEDIARVLNRDYVAIKVDREERPDIDQIYMTAVQRMTGDGGWPLSVWLLPDRRPFFGGTYFPPRAGVRGARVGLSELLARLARAYAEDPAGIAARADAIVADLRRAATPPPGDAPTAATIRTAVAQLAKGFDRTWGGFGGAPKFPRPAVLELLLRYARRTGDANALEMVTITLDRMAAGGIRDHVGGGFHRYATDAKWRVPHFEKMLYDNAQLAAIYVAAFQATGRADFAAVARDTLDYLLRDLRSPDGGFYAASDADSGGGEGRYFVWTAAEIDDVVGAERARIVREYFDVTTGGNFEHGTNILWRPLAEAEIAERLHEPPERVRATIAEVRPLLFAARARRPPPAIDHKIVVGWNALAISALARAAFALDEPRYLDAARTCAAYLLAHGRAGNAVPGSEATNHLLHVAATAARSAPPGFLDDHAFAIAALLDLHAADADPRWLREAIALATELDRRFADPAGGYFYTPADHEALLVRDKPDADEALPAGGSVAALAGLELYELTGDEARRTRAEGTIRAFGGQLARAPTTLPLLLAAVERSLDRTKQIVLVSPPSGAPDALLAKLRAVYLPNRILVRITDGVSPAPELAALVEGKTVRGGKPTAYVCIGTRCERPTTDPDELARQLAKIEPLTPP